MVDRQFAFIAGGGKYGSGALKWFLKKRGWKVVVCDEDERCQVSAIVGTIVKLEESGGFTQIEKPTLLVGDAGDALSQFYSDETIPKIVIPCVPFHLAAKVLTVYLARRGLKVQPSFEPLRLAFEKAHLEGVEYKLNQDHALAVASKMPFDLQCVSGCNQPQMCPVTKRKLLKPMYDLTAETLSYGKVDYVKVLRSHLLAPNIGGFLGEELKQTLDLCIKEEPFTVGLATACSCHAVMNIIRIED
nr:hypothetical protein [Candidatus Njordarchaeota archaeon]